MLYSFIILSCFVIINLAQDYRVLDFGAVGNGKTYDTKAVRDALSAAQNSNGGRVIFDSGYTFLTGPINVSSNVILDVRGVLLASPESADYYLIQEDPWYKSWGPVTKHPIIFSYNATNVTITGGGSVDGQGELWYNCSNGNVSASPCNGMAGPFLTNFVYTMGLTVENIKLLNSPRWTLVLSYATNVHVNNINITSPVGFLPLNGNGISNDGIDIVCSVNVTIENSHVTTGDDAVMIKSGNTWSGKEYGRPSENITVRNMSIGISGGIGAGVEIAAGVRNATFRDIVLDGAIRGINVQTERTMGGFVHDLKFYNIQMINVNRSIIFSMLYTSSNDTTNTPIFSNFILNNITIDNPKINSSWFDYVWILEGLPESPIENLLMDNIRITNVQQYQYIRDCTNVTGMCFNVTPECPKCLTCLGQTCPITGQQLKA